MTGPWFDEASIDVTRTGGGASIPTTWKEPLFTCHMTIPGGLMNLDDHEKYIVAGDSFTAQTMTWRRQQVQSPYVAGKFTTHAVPDMVTEQLNIWVLGDNQMHLQRNLADLIDAFSQVYYQITWSVDIQSYTWNCEMADYSIDFTNTLTFSRHLSFKANIPRLPAIIMGTLV
jgi:hypothetical protein